MMDRLQSWGCGISVQPFMWRFGFVQPAWMAYSRLFAVGPFRIAWTWR